ncbi:hypothetical protein MNBD_GAMMA26-664 [hydrothermal vent metagenome]|uniref:Uncharacterized protein n=1 Tax=hydrothermal vent metagenome TaxID=652676 RepID=A0A3B1B337_9ZZZZ
MSGSMSGWNGNGQVRWQRLEGPEYRGSGVKKPAAENRFFHELAVRRHFTPNSADYPSTYSG